MEAIAALSLACNVVQLVDFTGTAIRVVTQVYQDGHTQDNNVIESTTIRLRNLCETIDSQVKSTTLETQLHQIIRENIALAQELIQELSKLKGLGSTWTKLKTGVKAIQKRTKIQQLQRRLSACERTVNTGMLAALMERNEALKVMQDVAFKDLDTVLQGFIVNVSQGQVQVTDLIKSGNAETRALILQTKDELTTQIDNLEVSRRRTQMMESLRDPKMNARLNRIDEASPHTCDSFFETSSPHEFSKWFQEGDGILWIQGKAGSGKSTLMKFIAQSPQVRCLIGSRSPKYALLHHFFWLSGALPQRDLHGLLCGLAYQLTELVDGAWFPDKLHTDDWSIAELEDFVLSSLKTLASSTMFIILIDALDEYDEQCGKRRLLNLITKLSQHSKICVSSRPEQFWIKHLAYNSLVRLEGITLGAIEAFIKHELESAGLKNSRHFVRDLAQRADGVFLWAFLATADLLRGLDSGATEYELRQRIERLPKDMENLYTSMLKRIGEDWPLVEQEAAVFFSTALLFDEFDWLHRSNRQMRLLYFYVTSTALLRGEPLLPEIASFEKSCERLKDRINFVCAGMLEILPSKLDEYNNFDGPNYPVWYDKVQFSHRTVRDFLLDAPYGRRLTCFDGWDIVTAICKLIEMECLLHCHFVKTLNWKSIEGMMAAVSRVKDQYELDDRTYLKMILSIRQVLSKIATPYLQQGDLPVEFMHKDRLIKLDDASTYVSAYHSVDFLGLTMENRTMCYFNSLGLNLESLSLQYLEYLLFCSMTPRRLGGLSEAKHPCHDIWKTLKPYGVTGKMGFWRHNLYRNKDLYLKVSAADMLLEAFLFAIMYGKETDVEHALDQVQDGWLDANDIHTFPLSIKECSLLKYRYERTPLRSMYMYVEGNIKYWLSIALSRLNIPQHSRKFDEMEHYKAVMPYRRVLFVTEASSNYYSYCSGVPISFDGRLVNDSEDGETLLHLWETSKQETKEFSEEDQKLMRTEVQRLLQIRAPCLKPCPAESFHITNRLNSLDDEDWEMPHLVRMEDCVVKYGLACEGSTANTYIAVFKD